MKNKNNWIISAAFSLCLIIGQSIQAQGVQVTSPVVHSDRSISFSIQAPNADSVKLGSPDLPGVMFGLDMKKGEDGIWTITTDPVVPGAYRYNFNVDGLFVLDPVNALTSQSNSNSWSLVNVSGDPNMDTREVPHGAVAEVTYYSGSLERFRRMHIYTPPGYESDDTKEYPVFYLLHGALDSDDSWSTVGRAGFIVDNLIADGKAVPMIIVMPAGHTEHYRWGGDLNMQTFVNDFNQDIKPYIESHYRVKTDRANTAMAGLSMGGAHTLEIAIPNLEDYAYIGVFSSGVFSLPGGPRSGEGPDYAEMNKSVLTNEDLKEGLELFWFATGRDDFLLQITENTVQLFKDYGFDVEYKETEGAHTWLVWRDYLVEFTPRLFK